MIAVALRVAALILLAAGVARTMGCRSASLRAALWTATLLAALLVPLLPSLQVVVPVTTVEPAARLTPFRLSLRVVSQPETSTTPETPPAFAPDPVGWEFDPARFALGIYLLGVVLSGGGAALALVRAARLVRRSRPCPTAILEAASQIARERGLRTPRVALAGGTPLVAGPFRPTILLPDSAVNWDEVRLETVLRHEIAHVERGDGLELLLARLTFVVYWCHPLVLFAARQLRQECERAADDAALAGRTQPSDYAEELLAWSRGPAAPAATLPMVRRSGLAARLRHILDPKADRRLVSRRAKVGVSVGALLLATALPAARAEFARTVSVVTALPPRPVDPPSDPASISNGPPGPALFRTPDGSSIRILHLLTMGSDLVLHAWDIHGRPVRVTDARERLYVKNQVKANPSASKRWIGAYYETFETDPDPHMQPGTTIVLYPPSRELYEAIIWGHRNRYGYLSMTLVPPGIKASNVAVNFTPNRYRTVWTKAIGKGENDPQLLAQAPIYARNVQLAGLDHPLRWVRLPKAFGGGKSPLDWEVKAIMGDGTEVWTTIMQMGTKGEAYYAFSVDPKLRIARVWSGSRKLYGFTANNLPLMPKG